MVLLSDALDDGGQQGLQDSGKVRLSVICLVTSIDDVTQIFHIFGPSLSLSHSIKLSPRFGQSPAPSSA